MPIALSMAYLPIIVYMSALNLYNHAMYCFHLKLNQQTECEI